VWTWGFNGSGALGDNTLVNKSSPIAVIGGHFFTPGSYVIRQTDFKVTPGVTYNFNAFLNQIENIVVRNSIVANNVVIVVEYIV